MCYNHWRYGRKKLHSVAPLQSMWLCISFGFCDSNGVHCKSDQWPRCTHSNSKLKNISYRNSKYTYCSFGDLNALNLANLCFFKFDRHYSELVDSIGKVINLCIKCICFLLQHGRLLGDGRWRQVIRRCASVADTGVTGVCNWGVYENGIYWQECYCSEDECNSASFASYSFILLVGIVGIVVYGIVS